MIFRMCRALKSVLHLMSGVADITAELKEVTHAPKLRATSAENVYDLSEFRGGCMRSASGFLVRVNGDEYAVSQWVSPKRTRSFPFARVYDTLHKKIRVTIIPFCKDEGADGDRDFVQWDTVSLMSLLNVHVIFCHYISAEKSLRPKQQHKNKITNQTPDYNAIADKLLELHSYQSSALHWNVTQLENLSAVAQLTIKAYQNISQQTGVRLHSEHGIAKKVKALTGDVAQFKGVAKFKDESRKSAQRAQHSEVLTDQPKENTILEKARVTITNLIGGKYYWTADECCLDNGVVYLIEKKHTKNHLAPTVDNLKDAFIKMALFANINTLYHNGKKTPARAVVGLTTDLPMHGALHSGMNADEINAFFDANAINQPKREMLRCAIIEAQCNRFGLFLVKADITPQAQSIILRALGDL